jgi:S1/P1 Nuclease
MKRLLTPLLGMTAVVALSSTLGAFGDSGHRIIGRVAELYLDQSGDQSGQGSRALTEIRKILRPQETLADATVWPDTIKDPLYEDGDTPLFRLEHPAQDTYHYTNIAFQAARYDLSLPGARPTDILQITRECVRVLRGTSKTFTAREALRMLAHTVGDMHQPLHTGNSFVSASGPLRFVLPEGPTGWRSTAGGNALVYGPQDRFNLHSYWDTHIVNLAMRNDDVMTYASRLFSELAVAPEWKDTGDPDAWPERWINEALVYAKEAHQGIRLTEYIGPDEAGRVPHRWRIEQPAGYDDRSRARIRIQLAKGGYRLAAILKGIWPGS